MREPIVIPCDGDYAEVITNIRTGERTIRPLVDQPVERAGQAFPSQWHLDAEIAALKRAIAGVTNRLNHAVLPELEGDLPPERRWHLEQLRDSLIGEREHCHRELERLAEPEPVEQRPQPTNRRWWR
jgi:hypothetical protein